ncbi:MAG: hypothetical protein IJ190_13895 [Prevotella sp.]|nr:hypothetical protein [Prevotella sp.]
MIVANPIYDVVFKYLMEDTRIARTILSALLKEDIVKVEVRPHEYTNSKRENISVFRIDFAATIRKPDGTEQLILIELQKTWLPTETLRFRQYLGVQYENKNNIIEDSKEGFAIPMIAVYLLGHKVGDIEEPVLYVRHASFDYNGKPVTKGLPDPFIDSLTHESIIVQIPRLHGQINNRLDEVLSIFDQTRANHNNQHELNIADDFFPEDDAEMQRILRRLLMAATDSDMRMDMNVEDEYFSIIEKQDTELMIHAQKIAEQSVLLKKQDDKLKEQDEKLKEQNDKLKEQDEKMSKMLIRSVKALMASGMTIEQISQNLGLDMKSVSDILQVE